MTVRPEKEGELKCQTQPTTLLIHGGPVFLPVTAPPVVTWAATSSHMRWATSSPREMQIFLVWVGTTHCNLQPSLFSPHQKYLMGLRIHSPPLCPSASPWSCWQSLKASPSPLILPLTTALTHSTQGLKQGKQRGLLSPAQPSSRWSTKLCFCK